MGLRSGALGPGIRDPGSGKKPNPDPGSRGQGSKRHRIPDLDPQHWIYNTERNGYIMNCTLLTTRAVYKKCVTYQHKRARNPVVKWHTVVKLHKGPIAFLCLHSIVPFSLLYPLQRRDG
jgi:hypothetical protein